MTEVRNPANRIKNYTGTVHYAAHGKPLCGTRVYAYWQHSIATVTCSRCIAAYGLDTPGQSDPVPDYYADDHARRRAAERAARQEARTNG